MAPQSFILLSGDWKPSKTSADLKCSFENRTFGALLREFKLENVSVFASGDFPEQNSSGVTDLLLVFESELHCIFRNSDLGFLSTTPGLPNMVCIVWLATINATLVALQDPITQRLAKLLLLSA